VGTSIPVALFTAPVFLLAVFAVLGIAIYFVRA
jgi:hypothetical protein